ncbi:TIGR01620 family protein [Otariodibacter oris]|uniref:UPF0283 membrane protein DES31_1009 n=1 Tax=Otariodibacter oris TaxID=1032623 RepID=A0A420XHM7_9PAST|nr:TIGR01620 family protein [Otariodibacter oris]QGM81278.1 TIGR01620 family protein [Otariodibacter oris]RKR72842.1 putative membrane protein [Otariodibacter oris]
MDKKIFSEEEQKETILQPKQEFSEETVESVELEEESKNVEAELIIEESLKPSRFWIRVLLGVLVLFCGAVVAQSIQWLIDTWMAHQWIYFAFSIVFFCISLTGIGTLIVEWNKLRWLRKHYQNQQMTQQWLVDKNNVSGEIATEFCQSVIQNLSQTPMIAQAEKRWKSQLDEGYNSQEVLYLFSQNVLIPLDSQAKKMISQSAIENMIIVAVSPLAIVDVLMMAWRNIALVNKITKVYGMELGYFSRLKLFRMVLTNMVFAGATEIMTDVGMEFFSQNLTAKLSMRAAQGMGAGLLTARLGVKAMEFCRPVAFTKNERPKIAEIRQELIGVLKDKIFNKSTEKEFEKV